MKNFERINITSEKLLKNDELINLKGGTGSGPCWYCHCNTGTIPQWYVRAETELDAETHGDNDHWCDNQGYTDCFRAGSDSMCWT